MPLKLVFALAWRCCSTARRGLYVYRAVFYLPSMLGASVAVAVLWRADLRQGRAAQRVAGPFGIARRRPGSAIRLRICGRVILLSAWEFGSPMLIFLAGLRQIPTDVLRGRGDRRGRRLRRFLRITLPLLSPMIFFNLVLQMIFGFTVSPGLHDFRRHRRSVGLPLLYSLYLYQKGFGDFQMGYAAAMAWALLLVIGAFTALIFRSSLALGVLRDQTRRLTMIAGATGRTSRQRRRDDRRLSRLRSMALRIRDAVPAAVDGRQLVQAGGRDLHQRHLADSTTFTLDNYVQGWAGFGGVTFTMFFRNSLIYSVFGTILVVCSSALTAYGVARLASPAAASGSC